MRTSNFIIILLLVFPLSLFAQSSAGIPEDITGLWSGTLYSDTTKQYCKYEIVIIKDKGKYTGFSHTWFNIDGKQYYGVKKINIKKATDGKIIILDDELLVNNYPQLAGKNIRQLNILTLETADSVFTLKGPFVTNRTKEYQLLTGSISLQRNTDFWQSALIPHLKQLGREKDLSFVKMNTPIISATVAGITTAQHTKEKK